MTTQQSHWQEILKAKERISNYVHKTPIFTSSQADGRTGRKIFYKAENLQKTGSFKARGALNACLKLKESNEPTNGVITHSSGNHGQALAWAAKIASLPCYVVVAETTPAIKKSAIRNYGAIIIECGVRAQDRYDTCEKVRKEKNLTYISTSDNWDVIHGQGTIAMELLEELPDLDAVLVAVSGGGMAAGIALAAKYLKPDIKIFVVTPTGKMLEKCLLTGERPWSETQKYLDTIADGIRIQQTGYITTPILCQLVKKKVFEMTEEEIVEGMKFSFERMKLVVEAAAGAAVAASLSDQLQKLDASIKNVGVIICGGNLDIENLPW